ncbi:MAG: tRNA lysidine(34) synthetase TilS [Verrucomicrobia bacterium]|nr:tRNA lysidine(34) synthetase TilS [Verrucomicrobiota bacterium]
MSSLRQQVSDVISDKGMISRGDRVLIAVSGGVDSVVLLHILYELSVEQDWYLAVAHYNHNLRGAESDADERFVQKNVASLELPFFAGRGDVRGLSEKEGVSIEMAARRLRHEFLARTAEEWGCKTVAVGHQRDDQAELFLLRLLRGAGGTGLGCMKPVSMSPVAPELRIIRPLLYASKPEIREYAQHQGIESHEDASNTAVDFQRNRIRHVLMPLLREEFQRNLDAVLVRDAELIGDDSDFVEHYASELLRSPERHADFNELHVAVQRRIIRIQLLERGIDAGFDLTEFLRCNADGVITAPDGVRVSRDRSGIIQLQRNKAVNFNFRTMPVELNDDEGKIVFEHLIIHWCLSTGGWDKTGLSVNKPNTECFDADKIGAKIVLRHWRPGDRFRPIGMPCSVKLQDVFTNQKVPQESRRGKVVAEAENGGIFWVEGLRIADSYKITDDTICCLTWRWTSPETT